MKSIVAQFVTTSMTLRSVIRTAASLPAPLSKICPTIGAARFAA